MNSKPTLSHRNSEPESSVLYVVGTPIGNLYDISKRAIKILNNVSLIACEDTRQTKKIMNRFEISNILISCNKDNYFKKIPILINHLKAGKSIALVSTDYFISLRAGIGKKITLNFMGSHLINCNVYLKYEWYFFSSIRNFKFCTHFCQ